MLRILSSTSFAVFVLMAQPLLDKICNRCYSGRVVIREAKESSMMTWRLKEIAEPERWNAHTLAAATGLNYMTVHGIWTNRSKRADLTTMEKLARVLHIQPGELIAMREA